MDSCQVAESGRTDGERSSHTWFVLKYLLGYPDVRNYDGSWTEWGTSCGRRSKREATFDRRAYGGGQTRRSPGTRSNTRSSERISPSPASNAVAAWIASLGRIGKDR